MAGWNLKEGLITEYILSEDRIWSLSNFVFSDSSKKRNTYKFGLIKSLVDNAFNGIETERGMFYSYEELFARFAENYWNLVVKYNLRQMRKDGKSIYSKIETIFFEEVKDNPVLSVLEFENIQESVKQRIIKKVTAECKRCVIGALYEDFDGVIYEFDLKSEGITLNYCIHNFILKHKTEIERLNYYSWARFLEQINGDDVLVRVIDKLELATPKRSDLSIYREILRTEFEEDTCFYCGKKLTNKVHVDHFIPWSFIKDDKIWNFVLSCPTCNTKKNNKIPNKRFLQKIGERNKEIQLCDIKLVQDEFVGYSEGMFYRIWTYAKASGLKEYV